MMMMMTSWWWWHHERTPTNVLSPGSNIIEDKQCPPDGRNGNCAIKDHKMTRKLKAKKSGNIHLSQLLHAWWARVKQGQLTLPQILWPRLNTHSTQGTALGTQRHKKSTSLLRSAVTWPHREKRHRARVGIGNHSWGDRRQSTAQIRGAMKLTATWKTH